MYEKIMFKIRECGHTIQNNGFFWRDRWPQGPKNTIGTEEAGLGERCGSMEELELSIFIFIYLFS
jgi:hypothetical protein